MTDDTYDVFISYSHHDGDWVTGTLLPRLEAAGLRACIDYRDFIPGRPALINMQEAVKDSRHTLLVLTPAWVESQWTLYESIMVRTSDPAGMQRRTVPLRLERCELPEFISMLTWVDFTRPERLDIAWTQLLTALGAAPIQEPPEAPERADWCLAHPYPMPPNFTGRLAERQMLSEWLESDPAAGGGQPLLVLRALGGFGKSALAWHWLLHDVDPARWPRVVWWGFYDEPNFDAFLREALDYLAPGATFSNPRQQVDALLRHLRRPGTLLVLDGFERALRAYGSLDAPYQADDPPDTQYATRNTDDASRFTFYALRFTDCISPLADHLLRALSALPGLQSKVLMTTRLCPRALEAQGGGLLQGCREVELTQMAPADAVAFFRARGVRGSRAEIERACAPYGYHPLSLRLLAGLVVEDPQQPGDVRAARRLDVSGDLVRRRHHVLETAYARLAPDRQRLLSRIACFRGPVGYEALRALAAQTSEVSETSEVLNLDPALRELVARGLLHHDRQTGRYDLHPIVRRYAYDRLGGPARAAAHGHLRDYFAAVAPPDRVAALDDLAPVVELYHHTVRAGQYDEAFTLFRDRLQKAIYYQFGAYQLCIELLRALFPDGEDRPPRLKDEGDQGWTLNELANSYSLSGQSRRAVALLEQDIAIRERLGLKQDLPVVLRSLADDQLKLGALRAAEANLRRSIALSRDMFTYAAAHRERGRLLAYRGAWAWAEGELEIALNISQDTHQVQLQGLTWAYLTQRALLLARSVRAVREPPLQEALAAARRALELADEWQARMGRPNARDYVRAHWLLGAAHRASGDLDPADRHLTAALTRCRAINVVEHEADILLDLARLRGAQGHPNEARRQAEEAQLIAERCGYVLQGADVHLFLAQIEIENGDRAAALAHARQARNLATCDGPPDYTYKVAYEEAGALLAHLQPEP